MAHRRKENPPSEAPASVGREPGQGARLLAARVVDRVITARVTLDEALELERARAPEVDARDAALARAIALACFRHLGFIRKALDARLQRGLASLPPFVRILMETAAAQILYLDAPDHAAVDIAVGLVRQEPGGHRFTQVANAVLRRIVREAREIGAADSPLRDNMPAWLADALVADHGPEAAEAIARAHLSEPALDLTVKGDAALWAERLDALILPDGSLRLRGRAPVPELPGYAEGAWWVQDASSAVPARLLRLRPGDRAADLCAAPGGKTAQLAAAGADVTAVDRSAQRLRRLEENLARLSLTARIVTADAERFEAEPFDAVLLDAPCTATGTIRRNPEVAWLKQPQDQDKLIALQARLLDRAVMLTRPGGRLVYCTCSLQKAEGEDQVTALLARHGDDLALDPIRPEEVGVPEALTARGEFRALPHQLPGDTPRLSGWGGFFAARFVRSSR